MVSLLTHFHNMLKLLRILLGISQRNCTTKDQSNIATWALTGIRGLVLKTRFRVCLNSTTETSCNKGARSFLRTVVSDYYRYARISILPFILGPMTSVKLSNVQSLTNSSLKTMAECTIPATLGRGRSCSLKEDICSWLEMSVYERQKYVLTCTLKILTCLSSSKTFCLRSCA